jgi:hypothetical protein
MTDINSIAAEKKAKKAAYLKVWQLANKEKTQAYQLAYRAEHKEKSKAYRAEHYKANADEYKANASQWQKENPERRYAITKKWRLEHPELYIDASKRAHIKHRPKILVALKKYRDANPEIMRASNAAWHLENPGADTYHQGLRRTRKMQAQPAWADLNAIKAIYRESKKRQKETGIAMQVDHDIPLVHPLVCGLHCEFNLRIITRAENQSKHNRFSVE